MIDILVGYQGHMEIGAGVCTIIMAEELVLAMRGRMQILEKEVMMDWKIFLVPGFKIHQERGLFLVVGVSRGDG